MTIDELVNFDGNIPDDVTFEDKSLMEQVKLIAELEPEEKNGIPVLLLIYIKKWFKNYMLNSENFLLKIILNAKACSDSQFSAEVSYLIIKLLKPSTQAFNCYTQNLFLYSSLSNE